MLHLDIVPPAPTVAVNPAATAVSSLIIKPPTLLITREDQAWSETDFGPDYTQQFTFAFLRASFLSKPAYVRGSITLLSAVFLDKR